MPRKARNICITKYSHIIVQGIEKKYIFEPVYFKELYLKLLQKNLKCFDISVLAYCIMDNHAHILLYAEYKYDIMKFMHRVNTGFAIKYNKINNRVGYVFKERYHLQPITSKRQLENCIVYIHRNPIKANLTSKYSDYRYSSYNEFLNKKIIITDKSIELIFGGVQNYKKAYEKMHQEQCIEDISDV